MASSIKSGHALLGTAIFDRLFTSTISSSNLIETTNLIDINRTLDTSINSTLCTPLLDQQLQNPLVIFSVICMVIINLVVIFGNVLVILSVFLYTKLRTVTNLFILSLAVADLLLGVTVIPSSLTQTISKDWHFGRIWCMGWLVIDVWLSTASILNLVAISVDRYLAITRPLKYRTMMTAKRAKILIASAWIVSFLICFPPLVHTGWNQAGSGLIEVNTTQKTILNRHSVNSHQSSSSNLSSNQHSSNSFKQTTNNFELNRSSFLSANQIFRKSVVSQRNKRDRKISDLITSVPLIADSNLILWSIDHDLRRIMQKSYKTNLNSQNNDDIKNILRNHSSKYKNLVPIYLSGSDKQNATFKHSKRWRRSEEFVESKLVMDCKYQMLQCVLFDSKGYVIYSAVGSFFIPMIIMIFFYWRIYLVAMYTTSAMNRGYISKKSIRINPLAVFGGSKNQADSLDATKFGLNHTSDAINIDANPDADSNMTLRVHRGYMKDQQSTINLTNDMNRRSANRSSYDSSGISARNSTSTTVTVRANSTVDSNTAAQLCRRLLPTRLSNRLLPNNDAKQLRKIRHRSVRCLDRTQNIISLATDSSPKLRAVMLKRTQSDQCIELGGNKIDENLKHFQEPTPDNKENERKEEQSDIDKKKETNTSKNNQGKSEKNNKSNDTRSIRMSNSEKNISQFQIEIKPHSLSSDNLQINNLNYQEITFDIITKDTKIKSDRQTGSQIQLCIVPPREDKKLLETDQGSCNKKEHLVEPVNLESQTSVSKNGYSNFIEINNNKSTENSDLIDPIEAVDVACDSYRIQSQEPLHLTTSVSKRSSYWSKFSRKRTYLSKTQNQATNNSGRFEKRRFLAETKAAKTVGIIVGCFWLCWFPFFTVYLTRGLCEDKNCIPDIILTLFTWLGYINSALNPIIYGCLSKDFRRAFKNIICKCKFTEETGITTLIRQIHLPNLFEEDMI